MYALNDQLVVVRITTVWQEFYH